ncbi:MAG: DNA-directed RNA polymerase subunit alpha, partial [Planctomycetes bacterium]|nr:DNA-directed RNA polymerase subunit alpha [Planctomycetota bacterium]
GYGITVGNALRRVLVSGIEGAAPVWVRIDGVEHEFDTIPGVLEDVTEIVLNLKHLVVRMHTDEAKRLTIDVNKSGELTAGDIQTDGTVEVVNKTLHLATLSSEVSVRAEMEVRRGRGYVVAEELGLPEDLPIGTVPLDAMFTPVRRVRYETEDTRVGQRTNYDRLILELWTDGSVRPDMALVEAAKILRKHLNPFVQYLDLGAELPEAAGEPGVRAAGEELEQKLSLPITDLDLSVRALHCLEGQEIKTVRDLVRYTPAALLQVRNFGRTSLTEVKSKLEELGLSLGMEATAEEVGAE